MAASRRRKITRSLCANVVLVSLLLPLVSCSPEREPAIESPGTWQSHLQQANLPENFTPAIVEKIYIPVYSHIYHEDKAHSTQLAGTLSIRNTDASKGLVLKSVAYYDTTGLVLQELCKEPVVLGPMATAEIVVPRTNSQGGSGANFVVEWMAEKPISEPIAEAVMISLGSSESVSFVSRGSVVSRSSDNKARGRRRESE